MSHRLRDFKPGVTPGTHLLLAALLWTAIGWFLMLRGVGYLGGSLFWPLVIGALLIGTIKSRYVLDKSARRGIERINHFSGNTCIGAVYSWKTWLLVIAMMLFGLIVRSSPISRDLIGFICVAIGWSLVWSSRFAWRTWYASR